MQKDLLINFFNLDKEIKEKTKIRDGMKKEILEFLKQQKNNSYRYENVLAYLQCQDRTIYNVPVDIKKQYASIKSYELVKVEVK